MPEHYDLPKSFDVEHALWRLLRATPQGISPARAYSALAAQFGLSFEQVHRRIGPRDEPQWSALVRHAYAALVFREVARPGRTWRLAPMPRGYEIDVTALTGGRGRK